MALKRLWQPKNKILNCSNKQICLHCEYFLLHMSQQSTIWRPPVIMFCHISTVQKQLLYKYLPCCYINSADDRTLLNKLLQSQNVIFYIRHGKAWDTSNVSASKWMCMQQRRNCKTGTKYSTVTCSLLHIILESCTLLSTIRNHCTCTWKLPSYVFITSKHLTTSISREPLHSASELGELPDQTCDIISLLKLCHFTLNTSHVYKITSDAQPFL
jgi:hypothetical protein